MKMKNLNTSAVNTWCPGCGNFGIEVGLKAVLSEMAEQGELDLDKVVLATGIGCHGKIADYVNVNSFYSLHGRAVPAAVGIKMANPDLTVIVCVGDGDVLGEGLDHLVFAAKRNSNIKVLVHENRIYALTTGQYSPTSPKGFRGRSTPTGSLEQPLNPIELMLASGASFVARTYSGRLAHQKKMMQEAIKHNGFAFLDILQPCFVYYNTYPLYNQNVYELGPEHDPADSQQALKLAKEWSYQDSGKIPVGIFYQKK
ncbi:MAG: 2-oxoacid:ferredoxin oxidoreductase subunit beta [Candidatus Nealsonbacteria bacterium]|nr:2-oxoacid:ferredoxin oxidoreductase subunit beta [Candidatus Nealsonbacteria bacterium]